MSGITAIRSGALVLLLASTVVGVAGAQKLPPRSRSTGYCTGGLFTLVGGQVKFHVSLDDHQDAPPALVVMRLIDHEGTVVKSLNVKLEAGRSATLEHSGVGLFRVQAETRYESDAAARIVSARRTVVGMMELFDDFRAVIPVRCAEPADPGRIPG